MFIQQPILPSIALYYQCSCAMPTFKPKKLNLLPQYIAYNAYKMLDNNIIDH